MGKTSIKSQKQKIGNIVLVNFPFSNLKGQKLRPALVLAEVEFENLILCQITSKPYSSKTSIKIGENDFAQGSLPIDSYVRPDKLFTADKMLVKKIAGKLEDKVIKKILNKVGGIFKY